MPQDINTISVQDLTRPDVLEKISKKVDVIVRYADEEEAWELSRQLKRFISQKDVTLDPEIFNQLKRWSALVNYISLPAQLDENIIELFRVNFKDVLGLDRDTLMGRLQTKLWVTPFGPREEFCEKLIQALKENKQQVGDLTLGEWIATYIHSYPRVTQMASFEEKDFLNKNERAQTLSPQDKKTLAKLLRIYDFLRPFEIWAQYMRAAFRERGRGLSEEEKKQVRLGRALGEVAARGPQGYQGPQDFRDIKPQGIGPGRSVPPAPPPARQAEEPPPAASPPAKPRTSPRPDLAPEPTPSYPPPSSQPEESSSPPTPEPVSTQEIKAPRPISPPPQPRREISEPPKAPAQASTPLKPETPAEQEGLPEPPGSGVEKKPAAPQDITASNLTVAQLERAAEIGDPVQEERLRKVIRQGFNKLPPEVRRYILNSPFWAE